MFETYYEQIQADMASKDGYIDYRDSSGENKLYAICKCKGRIPDGESLCIRNPDKELAHRGQGWCLWYMPNGSCHCGHRFPPKDKPK